MTTRTFMLPLLLLAATCSASKPEHAKLDGRLFFSTTERRTLESDLEHPAQPMSPTPIQPPASRRFSGVLWRDGRMVALWIDGTVAAPAAEPSIRLNHHGATVSGRALLPGQTFSSRENSP